MYHQQEIKSCSCETANPFHTHTHTHTKQNIKIIKEYQPPAKKKGKLTAAKKYMCHIRKYMSQEAASCTSIIKQSSSEEERITCNKGRRSHIKLPKSKIKLKKKRDAMGSYHFNQLIIVVSELELVYSYSSVNLSPEAASCRSILPASLKRRGKSQLQRRKKVMHKTLKLND